MIISNTSSLMKKPYPHFVHFEKHLQSVPLLGSKSKVIEEFCLVFLSIIEGNDSNS